MKKYLLVILMSCCGNLLLAQTNIKIMDFYISPALRMDNIGRLLDQQDSTEIMITFKINRPDLASRAHIYFGTQQDSFDVLSLQALFSAQGNKYYTDLNGMKEEIKAYSANVYVKLSTKQYTDFSKATLFVEASDGQFTSHLYSNK
jgi:hypothetical protein